MENIVAKLMTQRVTKLENYLTISGLKDYELTEKELKAIKMIEHIEWQEYMFKDIFDTIKQGKRLKNADQIPGNIAFVMSGVTNTGVTNYISNPVNHFPANSITIDIFGNTFYRNYKYSAGDDTGVYWSQKTRYTQNTMLFFATSASKAIEGKYSYGNKLRSSRSKEIRMQIPIKNERIDYYYMNTLITAIKKLVIKDVVLYVDGKNG